MITSAATFPSTTARPLLLTSSAGSSSSASSASNAGAPSNTLDANSFITLLTAQLQAQDPLNPLDPNQMVDELTSMNTLQQIIQIRQDMDAMLANSQASTAGTQAPTNPPAPVTSSVTQPHSLSQN